MTAKECFDKFNELRKKCDEMDKISQDISKSHFESDACIPSNNIFVESLQKTLDSAKSIYNELTDDDQTIYEMARENNIPFIMNQLEELYRSLSLTELFIENVIGG